MAAMGNEINYPAPQVKMGGSVMGSGGYNNMGTSQGARAAVGGFSTTPQVAPKMGGSVMGTFGNANAGYGNMAREYATRAKAMTPQATANPAGGFGYDKDWSQSTMQNAKQGEQFRMAERGATADIGRIQGAAERYANEARRRMGPDASAAGMQAAQLNSEVAASRQQRDIGNELASTYRDLHEGYLADVRSQNEAQLEKFKDTNYWNMLSQANAKDQTGTTAAKIIDSLTDPVTGELRGEVVKYTPEQMAEGEKLSQMSALYDMAAKTGDASYMDQAKLIEDNFAREQQNASVLQAAQSAADRLKDPSVPVSAAIGDMGQMSEVFAQMQKAGGTSYEAGRLFADAFGKAKTDPKANDELADMLRYVARSGEKGVNLGMGELDNIGLYKHANGGVEPRITIGQKDYALADLGLDEREINDIVNEAARSGMLSTWDKARSRNFTFTPGQTFQQHAGL